TVTFTGSAIDTPDGNISANLVWTSNLQAGPIGGGRSFSPAGLTGGAHAITATVTDSGGLPGSAAIVVNVQAAPPTGITLTAQGFKQKGVRKANLVWTGTTGTVTVYRDTTIVTTSASGGAFTDTIPGKGGGTFIYKVCNATICSNNAT